MKQLVALALLTFTARIASAQRSEDLIARADAMLASGQVYSAESLYYRAASLEPRNPAARLALGRYLAARGVLRVGAVLMEEALYFGGNTDTISRYLGPVYAALGDWRTLATLRGTSLSFGERARAEWLMRNSPEVDGPDTTLVPYTPSDSVLGYVTIVVGNDTLDATIDPRVHGLVLDSIFRRRTSVRRFAARNDRDWRNASWVATTVQIGEMTLRNVPVSLGPTGHVTFARLGLDELGKLAPTFDQTAGRMLLRRTGRVRRARGAASPPEAIPTIAMRGTLWLMYGSELLAIDSPAARSILGARWTLNPRQGEVIPRLQ